MSKDTNKSISKDTNKSMSKDTHYNIFFKLNQ